MLNEIELLAQIIFLLPVAAFTVLALCHHRLPGHGDLTATSVLGTSLVLSVAVFLAALHAPDNILVNISFPWLAAGEASILSGGILVDKLTAVMLVVVTLVSFLVHLFSVKYMEGDARYGRYYCGLLLFTASMLGLVLANNMLYLFIFWELVGLSSYVLIGHWFEKKCAADAAIKAFITTRIGDIGMLIGILICYVETGSLEFSEIFAAVHTGVLTGSLRTLAGLGIFFGAMGKSAQFPLHVWLPDAMEGPTPVSALIHAATMVAAGVYLTGRMLPIFDSPTLLAIAYVGGFTALFAATIALVQDDIKKVLAYSTVSQLGYMTLALGVGGYAAGLFHLTTHAFFKAGLFLGAGAVIYAMHHEQSMSKYGGLWRKMPKTTACYLLSTLALIGFPGFSGFWSKDAILADVLEFSLERGHYFLPLAGFVTVMLTAFYMFRQFFLTFTGEPRSKHAYEQAHDVPWQMLGPLVILAILSLTGGGFGHWFEEMNPKRNALEQIQDFARAGVQTPLVQEARFKSAAPRAKDLTPAARKTERVLTKHAESSGELRHFAHQTAMILSTALALAGMALAWLMYFQRKTGKVAFEPGRLVEWCPNIHRVLLHKYYLDELYRTLFILPLRRLSSFSALFDRGVIDSLVNAFGYAGRIGALAAEALDRLVVDGLLVLGLARASSACGERCRALQTGYIRQYLLFTLVAVVFLSVVLVYLL